MSDSVQLRPFTVLQADVVLYASTDNGASRIFKSPSGTVQNLNWNTQKIIKSVTLTGIFKVALESLIVCVQTEVNNLHLQQLETTNQFLIGPLSANITMCGMNC